MSELPPANWYPDPEVPGQQRYWDGTQWTEHRAPGAGAAPATGSEPQWGQQQPQWGQAPQQPQWGGQQPAASGGTDGMAITALVIGILSCFLTILVVGSLGGIVAVVLGIIAMRRIRDSQGAKEGRGLAIAGVVAGGLAIIGGIVFLSIYIVVGSAFESGTTGFTDFLECVEQEAQTGQDLPDC